MKVLKRSYVDYSEEDLRRAIELCKSGSSVRTAAIECHIPKSTLIKKIRTNTTTIGQVGAKPYFTEIEENDMKWWLLTCAEKGYPRSKNDLFSLCKQSLNIFPRKKQTPFKNGTPSHTWCKHFLRRHPELKMRGPRLISNASAKVSKEELCTWHNYISRYFDAKGYGEILLDPSRLFNADESGFEYNPKQASVIASKQGAVHTIHYGAAKVSQTVLITCCADGTFMKPFILYKNKGKLYHCRF